MSEEQKYLDWLAVIANNGFVSNDRILINNTHPAWVNELTFNLSKTLLFTTRAFNPRFVVSQVIRLLTAKPDTQATFKDLFERLTKEHGEIFSVGQSPIDGVARTEATWFSTRALHPTERFKLFTSKRQSCPGEEYFPRFDGDGNLLNPEFHTIMDECNVPSLALDLSARMGCVDIYDDAPYHIALHSMLSAFICLHYNFAPGKLTYNITVGSLKHAKRGDAKRQSLLKPLSAPWLRINKATTIFDQQADDVEFVDLQFVKVADDV